MFLNLNVTLGKLLSLAIDAPKEATRRAVCFAPNLIRLARAQQAKDNRQELKRRIHTFFEDSSEFVVVLIYVITWNTCYVIIFTII